MPMFIKIVKITSIILIVTLFCAWMWFPYSPMRSWSAFGPEWGCSPQVKGDPICYKPSPK